MKPVPILLGTPTSAPNTETWVHMLSKPTCFWTPDSWNRPQMHVFFLPPNVIYWLADRAEGASWEGEEASLRDASLVLNRLEKMKAITLMLFTLRREKWRVIALRILVLLCCLELFTKGWKGWLKARLRGPREYWKFDVFLFPSPSSLGLDTLSAVQ